MYLSIVCILFMTLNTDIVKYKAYLIVKTIYIHLGTGSSNLLRAEILIFSPTFY